MRSSLKRAHGVPLYAALCILAILGACTWGIYDGHYTGGGSGGDGGGDDGGSGGDTNPVVVLTQDFNQNSSAVGPIVTDGTNVYAALQSSILSIPVAGGAVTTLAMANIESSFLATDGAYVYFEVNNSDFTVSIERIPRYGGSVDVVTTLSHGGAFATDGTNVYFTQTVLAADGGRGTYVEDIESVPATSGAAKEIGSLSLPQQGAGWAASAVATDVSSVYWVDSYTGLPQGVMETTTYSLKAISKSGGPITTLAGIGTPPIVTDGKSVYWVEYVANWDGGPTGTSIPPGGVTTVYAVPVGGGAVRTVASSPSTVAPAGASLATDGISVYWVTEGIRRAPVGGGPASEFVSASDLQNFNSSGSRGPGAIALDSQNVYWLLDAALMKRAK